MKSRELQSYHKHLTDVYDKRSPNHDKSDWHQSTSLKLTDVLTPRINDSILVVGTGTGTIAFHAASLVDPNGKVIGVDISEGMLEQARKKLTSFACKNIEFQYADMEHLDFPQGAFDKIYCANAFFCTLRPLQTPKHWHRLIKPGGALAFHAIPETSFFWVSLARDVLSKHGFEYALNTPTGSFKKQKCYLKKQVSRITRSRQKKKATLFHWRTPNDHGSNEMSLHQDNTRTRYMLFQKKFI